MPLEQSSCEFLSPPHFRVPTFELVSTRSTPRPTFQCATILLHFNLQRASLLLYSPPHLVCFRHSFLQTLLLWTLKFKKLFTKKTKDLDPPRFSGIFASVLYLAAFCGVVDGFDRLLNLFLDLNEALSSSCPVRSHHLRLEFGLLVLAYWPPTCPPSSIFQRTRLLTLPLCVFCCRHRGNEPTCCMDHSSHVQLRPIHSPSFMEESFRLPIVTRRSRKCLHFISHLTSSHIQVR